MKKIKLFIAVMITISSLSVYAQRSILSASSLVEKAHQQDQSFLQSHIIIAEATSSNLKSRLSSALPEFGTFKLNKEQLRSESDVPADYIRLAMPLPDGSTAQIELVKVNITTSDFKVLTPNGEETIDIGQHYRGIINNDPNTLAAISIFDNEISGTLSIPEKGDFTIGLMHSKDEMANGIHIIYNTKLYRGNYPTWNCAMDDKDALPYSARQLSAAPNDPRQRRDLHDVVSGFSRTAA
ncbi:MAG TPA: hypothetical protein VLB84_07695 [Bacteroidia bacterium]|nr:hypothetical protein [Bacteroidia bacterium]